MYDLRIVWGQGDCSKVDVREYNLKHGLKLSTYMLKEPFDAGIRKGVV